MPTRRVLLPDGGHVRGLGLHSCPRLSLSFGFGRCLRVALEGVLGGGTEAGLGGVNLLPLSLSLDHQAKRVVWRRLSEVVEDG